MKKSWRRNFVLLNMDYLLLKEYLLLSVENSLKKEYCVIEYGKQLQQDSCTFVKHELFIMLQK